MIVAHIPDERSAVGSLLKHPSEAQHDEVGS